MCWKETKLFWLKFGVKRFIFLLSRSFKAHHFHFIFCTLLVSLQGSGVYAQSLGKARLPASLKASSALLHDCSGKTGSLRCGEVRVPWDYHNPTGETLTVGFEYYPHRNQAFPSAGTIVAQEGGPGGSTTAVSSFFQGIFSPLLDRYDLLLVDARGTGKSEVVNCIPLELGTKSYPTAIRDCAKQLGSHAHLYGTENAVDDLQTVLDALGIQQITLYGDSYGTAFVQTFAARHPQSLRAAILDGAYLAGRADPFARDAAAAIRRAWHELCTRKRCEEGTLHRFAAFAKTLRKKPLRKTLRSNGRKYQIVFTEEKFALLLFEADSFPVIAQQLNQAVREAVKHKPEKLLQLVLRVEQGEAEGSVRDFSQGAYLAVHCYDDRQIWDRQSSFAQRREQFRSQVGELGGSTFLPISVKGWFGLSGLSLTECMYWSTPPNLPQPFPSFGPDIPALVLNGALDIRTPSSGARAVAKWFPRAHFVEIANTGHVTAVYSQCARGIIRHFVTTLTPGSTRCAAHEPLPAVSFVKQPHWVRRF